MLQFRDQIFEIVDIAGQIAGACAFDGKLGFALGLLLLPLLDQRGHARAIAFKRSDFRFQLFALGGDFLAHVQELGEVARQRINFVAHLRQHGAQHHGGAHRLQRVFG